MKEVKGDRKAERNLSNRNCFLTVPSLFPSLRRGGPQGTENLTALNTR
jgi:hypothetical protein